MLSRGLLASGGGLLFGAALAHAVGTTTAALVATGARPRHALSVLLTFGQACLYTLVLLISTSAAYAALALSVPSVVRSGLGLLVPGLLAYAVCAAALRGPRAPSWSFVIGPLWLATLAAVMLYVFLVVG